MVKKLFKKIFRKDEGISALEYALIAALVALAIIVGATALGTQMNLSFTDSAGDLQAAQP